MTRKRFRKLMMSMGRSRNQVNIYKPFSMWPFCFMPSICNYDYAWQLDKPIFELMRDIRKQINDGISFTYKGYTSCIRYDKKYGVFYGKLEDIKEHIEFHTNKIMNIEDEFQLAVENYLDFCARVGKEPERPQP